MAEKEIIGRMNAFRERNGTSKAEMSRQLDVDPGTFGNILNGKRGIPAELLIKFLQVYPSVSAEWLLRGTGDMCLGKKESAPLVDNSGSNNRIHDVSNINNGDTINRLLSIVEQKDKQINQLLQLLAEK